MFSNLLPQKKLPPPICPPEYPTIKSTKIASNTSKYNIYVYLCLPFLIVYYLFTISVFLLAVTYRSIEPNTTSKFPKMATISCSINPRINISKLRIWRKSEHLIRSRVQLQKYNIMYSKYSPLGCSTTLKVNPGILIHQIL